MNGPELRIGDAEREAAVTALGEHYAAGRLTKEEYDERAECAWQARTMSALTPLFADLPRPQAAHSGGPTRPTRPALDERGHPGWWVGARLLPVFVVLGAIVVLTHLPLFLLFVLGWILVAKMGRHRAHRSSPHRSSPHGQSGWVR